MALYYKAENSGLDNPQPIKITPKNGRRFTLDEMKALVGGWVQMVWLNADKCLLMDEEGKFKERVRINSICTKLAHDAKAIMPDDFIVGDVVLCDAEEVSDDDTDD